MIHLHPFQDFCCIMSRTCLQLYSTADTTAAGGYILADFLGSFQPAGLPACSWTLSGLQPLLWVRLELDQLIIQLISLISSKTPHMIIYNRLISTVVTFCLSLLEYTPSFICCLKISYFFRSFYKSLQWGREQATDVQAVKRKNP